MGSPLGACGCGRQRCRGSVLLEGVRLALVSLLCCCAECGMEVWLVDAQFPGRIVGRTVCNTVQHWFGGKYSYMPSAKQNSLTPQNKVTIAYSVLINAAVDALHAWNGKRAKCISMECTRSLTSRKLIKPRCRTLPCHPTCPWSLGSSPHSYDAPGPRKGPCEDQSNVQGDAAAATCRAHPVPAAPAPVQPP